MTRVTVAIPVHNGAPFIAETLRSLLNQKNCEIEIVCVDDASTDNSVSVIAGCADERVSIVRNEQRIGLAANWNRARELCRSTYLVIAHQDDVYEPDFAATLVRLLDEHPHAFAAHSRAATIDAQGRLTWNPAGRFKDRFWAAQEPQERDAERELRTLLKGNYVVAPAVMFRAEAMTAIGPFDERFQFVTDWEYWTRGLMAGFTLVGTHKRLVRFRRHAGTATRANELSLRRYEEELQLLRTLNAHFSDAPSYSAISHTLMNDFASRLASGESEGARRLREFGRAHVPHFCGSAIDLAMGASLVGGRAGGMLLRAALYGAVAVSVLVHDLTGGS